MAHKQLELLGHVTTAMLLVNVFQVPFINCMTVCLFARQACVPSHALLVCASG
jgi:hypothetical protein